LNNSEIIKDLSSRLNQSQDETKRLLSGAADQIQKLIDEDNRISIPNLGILSVSFKKERKSFNPIQKRFFMLPPKRLVKLRIASSLKKQFEEKRYSDE